MIEIDRVRHRFGDRTVLTDLTLTLAERRIALIGANGSGKSTFARLLNGLIVPTEGRVTVDGRPTADRRQLREVQRRVGFVFQNPDSQIVMPVVEEDLAFGLSGRGWDKASVARRVDAALDRYGLAPLRQAAAYSLSGGEKQLLALAAVLAAEPERVVLDEPTTLLDRRNKRRIAEAIAALPQPVVLATHDLDLVETFDRVLVFADGRVVADAAPGPAIAHYVEHHG